MNARLSVIRPKVALVSNTTSILAPKKSLVTNLEIVHHSQAPILQDVTGMAIN